MAKNLPCHNAGTILNNLACRTMNHLQHQCATCEFVEHTYRMRGRDQLPVKDRYCFYDIPAFPRAQKCREYSPVETSKDQAA